MKIIKKLEGLGRQTWLANVGIYASSRDKAADKFDQLFVDGSTLMNDLLNKGELVEAQLQAKLEARKMLQGKIAGLRAKLGFGNENRNQQIEVLSQRVDTLIEVVAKLAKQKEAEKKATTAKKPAAKRASSAVKSSAVKAPATNTAEAKVKKAPAKPRARKAPATKVESKK